MPVYEYQCEACNIQFEELFSSREDVNKYQQSCPCSNCGAPSKRVPSIINHSFKETPGRTSGSHDLDYPILDKAVGRSAEKKWAKYRKRKEDRDKIRKEHNTNALTISGNKVAPTSPDKMVLRDKAIKTFNKARKG